MVGGENEIAVKQVDYFVLDIWFVHLVFPAFVQNNRLGDVIVNGFAREVLLNNTLELFITNHASDSVVNRLNISFGKVLGVSQVNILESHLGKRLATAKDQIVLRRRADAGRESFAFEVPAGAPRGAAKVTEFRFRSWSYLDAHR